MKTKILRAVKSCAPLALLTCLTPLASVANAEENYRSAMFDFSGDELTAKVAATTSLQKQNQTLVLYCQSNIDVAGKASHSRCYDKAGNIEVVKQTESAVDGMAFTAAQVNGKEVPVRMSYRVAYHSADNEVKAMLIPNLGSMHERYGRDYIAPQERLDVSNWYDEYNKNSWVNGEAFLGKGDMSRVAATVDEQGKTDVVRTLDTGRAYKRDANLVKNAVKKSRFIPGFVNGKPVPMGYLAVVNYQTDSGSAVTSR